MVSNLSILSETATFSILVSFLTLGISAAHKEGAVLYPIYLWMQKLSKKVYAVKDKLVKYQQKRRGMRQASFWIDDAIKKADVNILKKTWWMKVLLLCPQCMPTFYGTLLYWTVCYNSPLYVWIIGIPIASTLNLIISKKLL